MKVTQLRSVDAAIRTLSFDERQKVFAWLHHLQNWENDKHIRKISKPTGYEGIQVLNTTDDIRIFFRLDQEAGEITIMDIAKPSRFKNVKVKAVME